MNDYEKVALFLDLETKHSLTERRIADVPYWSMVRYTLFFILSAGEAYLKSTHPDTVISKKSILRNGFSVLKYALHHLLHFVLPEADVLFMLCPRKIQSERGPIAVMLDFFCDELGSSFCIFEKPMRYRHTPYRIKRNLLYSDYFEIKRVLYSKLRIGEKEVRKAASAGEFAFLEDFNKAFESNVTEEWLIRKVCFSVSTYKACFQSFRSLLRRMKTKCVVHVVAYEQENQIMTLAAHSLNIPVIELQHGIINGLHIAYNYKSADSSIQPDKTLTWGEFWTRDIINSRSGTFLPCGYPFFENMVENRKSSKSGKNILIVSQGPFTDHMISIAVKLHELLAEHGYRIIFKLHPNQCATWRENYPLLAEFENKMEIVDDPQKGIYACFDESSIQIGISSTALLEGLAWDLQTFILDYRTCDYMEYLYKNGYAFLVKDEKEIAEKILSGQQANIPPEDLFWTKRAKQNIICAIQQEIKNGRQEQQE